MAINKNFSVKHGLQVNQDLVYADADNRSVGINTNDPQYDLDVNGFVGVSTIIVDKTIVLDGTIRIGASTGEFGQYLISTGAGVTWQSLPNTRTIQTYTAANGQTVFSVSYLIGLIDVYINGVKLSSHEYTATNGVSVTLNVACFGGETVEFVIYSAYNVSGVSTNGITIQDNGSTVGTPTLVNSINFVGAAVTASSSGFGVTVTTSPSVWGSNVTGIHTLSNVGIGTTTASSALTVSGDVTANSFVKVGGSSTEFLKADGTVDSSVYLTSYNETDTLDSVTARGSTTTNNISVGIITATGGFISAGSTTPIQISLVDNQLLFTAVGIGSTSLTLA